MAKNNLTIFIGDPGKRSWYLSFLGKSLRVIPTDIDMLIKEANIYRFGLLTEQTALNSDIIAVLSTICRSVIILTDRPLFNPNEGVTPWENLQLLYSRK